jgi:hypothetical protein
MFGDANIAFRERLAKKIGNKALKIIKNPGPFRPGVLY